MYLNPNPKIVKVQRPPVQRERPGSGDGRGADEPEEIDALEVYDLVRDIQDPEHPLTLETLGVVSYDDVFVDNGRSIARVQFTPTIPHCSMAALIGLCIHAKLLRSLPGRFRVVVTVADGMHEQQAALNKQLADKERIASALEKPNIAELVERCLRPSYIDSF